MSHETEPERAPAAKPYRFATRLNSLKPTAADGSGAALVRAASRVRGLPALELNYPQHFVTQPRAQLEAAIAESGLVPTALNLRFEGEAFRDGAFSSPRADARARAIRVAQEAVEEAARLGAGDAFAGALASELAGGATVEQALPVANAAGALAVTKRGASAALPTREAIRTLLAG